MGNLSAVAVLGGGYAFAGLELPHKMCFTFVAAHAADFFHRKHGGGKQVFSVVDTALNDIVHSSGSEYLLIQMLEVGFADGKLMCHAWNTPIKIRHVIDLGADEGHPFVISAYSFIGMGIKLFTEL